jgi:hypothetical protein
MINVHHVNHELVHVFFPIFRSVCMPSSLGFFPSVGFVELKRQITAAGHMLAEEYIDDGYTGLLDRPALNRMRAEPDTEC